MKVIKYEIIKESSDAKVGQIVYDLMKCDYGLASDDTRNTGVQHISVTFKEDGDYPSFTIPKHHLKQL